MKSLVFILITATLLQFSNNVTITSEQNTPDPQSLNPVVDVAEQNTPDPQSVSVIVNLV